MTFQTNSDNDMNVSRVSAAEYKFYTTGQDPYISTDALTSVLNADSTVLTFEYKLSAAIDGLQLFLAAPVSEERSKTVAMPVSKSVWKTLSVVLYTERKNFSWGKPGNYIRMDFGRKENISIQIRNIYFRSMTAEEKKSIDQSQGDQVSASQYEATLQKYLLANYPSKITNVKVQQNLITVSGNYSGTGTFAMAEVMPYEDITKIKKFTNTIPIKTNPFTLSVNRTAVRDGFTYDRILSKWAIVKVGAQTDELVAYGHYADEVTASQNLDEGKPASKKGLGGYRLNAIESDLDDLGIKSVTVNVSIPGGMYLTNPGNAYAHEYGGKTYYFSKSYFDELDATLKACQKRGIIVSAILLIPKKNDVPDISIGTLLQHPDFNGTAFFSMPNMTTAASVNCYAAALDFLASRYCMTGSPNGRIHKWIMHNEVDIASDWTNMGKPAITTFVDTYIKSMRMCYNIVRKYDPHPDVLASFSHYWAQAGNYPGRDMLKLILNYSTTEGDFHWGIAWHCYAQDLNNPRTWNDNLATFSLSSPLVTFKNLEVLDKWIKLKANLYKGTDKRTLWLSENGTNSPTYSESDLNLQAAGFAYGWQKIKALDGIDAFQWHNWIDNRDEFQLRIGLRRFSDDADDPLGKKPVWYAYQAAGTANEESVFAPYLKVIGIKDWNIVQTSITE